MAKFADPFSSHSKIVNRLRQEGLNGKTVLEVGVGDASLINKMVDMGATVDAIEMDPVAAELAAQHCRAVYQKNLENLETIDVEDQYDVIVMADVLMYRTAVSPPQL